MSTQNPSLYFMARAPWHTPWWMSRQQLSVRLARRGWPIVYSTGVWARDGVPWWRPWSGAFERIDDTEPGCVWVDRPGHWPRDRTATSLWDRWVVGRYARRLESVRRGSAHGRVAVVCHPSFWPLAATMNPDHLVYYIHDTYLKLPKAPRAWREYSESLAERADLIVAVAPNMARELPASAQQRVRILQHGVDLQLIRDSEGAPLPADLAAIPEPRLGYVGRINLKVDLSLIAEIAERQPQWHWVMVGEIQDGPIRSDPGQLARFERVRKLRNVHWLGPRDRREVPAYLAHFTVNTIPYRLDDDGYWADSAPTKLFEYLAVGRPVISTPLENARVHVPQVELASTAEAWIETIQRAIRGDDPAKTEERKARAEGNSWDERADRFEGWLRELGDARGANGSPAST